MSHDALKRRVHVRVLAEVPAATTRDELMPVVSEYVRDDDPLLTCPVHDRLVGELLDEIAGLGPLEPLLADPTVSEVMINGPHRVYVERAGRLESVDVPLDAAAVHHLVERVVGPLGLRLDRSSPIVDARLPDGSRLNAVIPPLALDGPCVSVRRFPAEPPGISAFGLSRPALAFLGWAVTTGSNIVVSGGTSAGKTTLCNALAAAVPPTTRVVTIEETPELRVPLPPVVSLAARPATAEGGGAVTVRDLVRAALRMRPARIVVGEVRGSEAFDLLQACNTGHDGSLTTVHANGLDAVPERLTALVLTAATGLPVDAVHVQLATAFDLVVHVTRHQGHRRVQAIGEIRLRRSRVRVAPLFDTVAGALVPVGAPERAPRRPDAPPPDPGWFG